jgi:hypothetical protein
LTEPQCNLVKLIDGEAIRLNTLCTRLLKAAKLEAQQVGLDTVEVNVLQLVSEVLAAHSAEPDRPALMEFIKAIMLAVAFLFWAAYQLWPDLHQAILFNDAAIALFVLDVFLVMVGWPATSPDESFAETYTELPRERRS